MRCRAAFAPERTASLLPVHSAPCECRTCCPAIGKCSSQALTIQYEHKGAVMCWTWMHGCEVVKIYPGVAVTAKATLVLRRACQAAEGCCQSSTVLVQCALWHMLDQGVQAGLPGIPERGAGALQREQLSQQPDLRQLQLGLIAAGFSPGARLGWASCRGHGLWHQSGASNGNIYNQAAHLLGDAWGNGAGSDLVTTCTAAGMHCCSASSQAGQDSADWG